MKIAFIGAGTIAQAHLDAIRYLGFDVGAVCTRGESGEKFALKNEIPNVYKFSHELVTKYQPDAVFVLTQPQSYAEILKVLSENQIPTFLEKPIGYTVNEAEKLRPLLPPKLFVGQNRRFYSGVRAIKEKLQKSENIFAQLFIPERKKDFAHRDDQTKSHWHMLNGIHGVDLLTYLVGMPKRRIGRDQWGKLDWTTLPLFNVSLYETNRNHRAIFMTNFDSSGGWRLHFFLPQEEIQISPFEETKIKKMTGLEVLPPSIDDQKCKPGFAEQARTFLEGVQGAPNENWVSFDDALNSMKTVEWLFGGE